MALIDHTKIQHGNVPFDYWIIDNFFDEELANTLSSQFPDYNSPDWLFYDNPVEHKKTIHDWYMFPKETYKALSNLVSPNFVEEISLVTGTKELSADVGLHGGGWHIHGNKGRLNVHMDYAVHPKLNLLRKFNLIVYLSKDWDNSWGGNLEFWTHDSELNKPKEKAVTIENKFNRAVLFDASMNSWHGFYDRINCPENKTRKSIAVYYCAPVPEQTPNRPRALFTPAPEQSSDETVLNLIKQRSM